MFPNIDRIKKIDCPIYIIHGKRDEIVHICHGRRLADNMKNKIQEPWFVEKAGHNDIESVASNYCLEITKFIKLIDSLNDSINES